jgi:hypothetical protein
VELQARIPALRGLHPGRLAPALSRFALSAEPWTAAEVHRAIDRVLVGHGWAWIAAPRHPAGYLARVLREIDHVSQLSTTRQLVRSGASSQAYPDLNAAFAAVIPHVGLHDSPCEHGVIGVDDGGQAPRCAFCRRGIADDD